MSKTAAESAAPNRMRWVSSAHLRIVAGFTASMLLVFIVIGLIVFQLLRFSEEREINERIETRSDQLISFVESGGNENVGANSQSITALMRAFLTQQYPPDDLLLIATSANTGAQMTMANNDVAVDPLFTPAIRDQLLEVGRSSEESSGTVGDNVRWGKVVVTGNNSEANLVIAVNTDAATENVNQVMRLVVFAMAVGLLVTALLSWAMAAWVLAPVRKVRKAAEKISADDLHRRVPVQGADEFVALAQTVNAMLDRVELAYQTQREFLDDAGHELRTPLTVVQGYLDMLPEDPVERADTLRLIQDELSRMTRIVEDLLVLARSRRPDFLRPSLVELEALALDVELKAEVTADRVWDVRPEACGTAWLDGQRITQALLQFAANAVRFTSPGARIEIGCRILSADEPVPLGLDSPGMGERIHWWVRDSGAGIPEGQESVIFQRFATARGQLRDRRGGTGLGLAIVASIAAGHDGIAGAANAPGGGAYFAITVPLRHQAPRSTKRFSGNKKHTSS